MSKFTSPLIVSPLPDGKRWKLIESFSYYVGKQSGLNNHGIIIEVPKGFVTDFASIPKIFWSILGHPMGKYAAAAVLHDFMYFLKTFSRKISDQIFENAMKILKVPKWKRKIIYYAVRVGGKWAWKNSSKNHRDS